MKGMLVRPKLVPAIAERRKTNTRRLSGLKEINQAPNEWVLGGWDGGYNAFVFYNVAGGEKQIVKPRYKVHEDVYIKEAWAISSHSIDSPNRLEVLYKTTHDDNNDRQWITVEFDTRAKYAYNNKWRSPMVMPAWAARYFIRINDVRPERLQEITLSDIKDEGIPIPDEYEQIANQKGKYLAIQQLFTDRWDSIYPSYPFAGNFWVWRYEFELVNKEV